ncbi:MAG TPA: type I-U CRISPR-associated protein Csb2 [Capillimicrobium sp.]|nr:type I-U CRISPR-associated protein Csb2 [Capillimicrobium sp.]
MVGLAVAFHFGRVHATPWGSHVNEALIEWPPSPWRIMRALLAAGYAHAGLRGDQATLRDALRSLAAAPLPHYVVPPAASAHIRHYLPLATWSSATPEKEKRLVVDAFLTVDPGAELQVAWDADLPADQRGVLARAAQAVGYLGRSESVCTMRVVDRLAGEANAVPAETEPAWGPQARQVELWAVERDAVGALDVSISELRRARRLMPDGVRQVPYLVLESPAPTAAPPAAQGAPTLAHLRVHGGARPSLHEAITVAYVLRAALQRRYDDVVVGGASSVFSGHKPDGTPRDDQHRHAHYLVGSDRGAKRVDHLWVWAPGGLGDDEVAAIASLRRLRFRDQPEPVRVGLAALGGERSLVIPQLIGPSTTWRSATPFVLPRHPKRRAGRVVEGPLDQIARELAYRGLPEPESIDLVPGAWSAFTLTRPGVSRRSARRAVGAVIRFPHPVPGPIAIGAHSHFGLGRFEPLT